MNIDDYEIKNYIDTGSYGYFFRAIEKSTKKEVLLEFIFPDQENIIFRKNLGFIQPKCHIKGLLNMINGRNALTEDDKKHTSLLQYQVTTKSHAKAYVDLSGIVYVTKYMKNGSVHDILPSYLESKGKNCKLMNPTIRSKIIFGIASTIKRAHAKSITFRNFGLNKVFLDDKLEPLIKFPFHSTIKDYSMADAKFDFYEYLSPELLDNDGEVNDKKCDVYSFGVALYLMFSSTMQFSGGKVPKNILQFYNLICKGKRPIRPESVSDFYWELIEKCWSHDPESRPSFEQITELLKSDKYVINEFCMKTDLKQLHEYQKRIESDEADDATESKSNLGKENEALKKKVDELTKKVKDLESILDLPNKSVDDGNCFIGNEDEENHEVMMEIGDGSLYFVQKVKDTRSNEIMCKKTLKCTKRVQIKDVQNAMKAFEVMHSIHHPCVCRAIALNTHEQVSKSMLEKWADDDDDDDEEEEKKETGEITTIALFLEFLDYNLSSWMKKITGTLKTKIVVEIAHALSFLHKKNMVYRDLKMDNIMMNSVFESKLIDFGLVAINESVDRNYSLVKTTLKKGTKLTDYMSPELLAEESSYNYKTDVYSFGVVMYALFTGSPPKQNYMNKLAGKMAPLPSPSNNISKECIDIIEKCLQPKTDNRPSLDEILDEIRAVDFMLAPNVLKDIVSKRDKELSYIESKL